LKYQFQVEHAHEADRTMVGRKERQEERVWGLIKGAAGWVGRKAGRGGGSRVGDGSPGTPTASGGNATESRSPGLDGEVELEDRRNVV